jgi:hypothetical protein
MTYDGEDLEPGTLRSILFGSAPARQRKELQGEDATMRPCDHGLVDRTEQ